MSEPNPPLGADECNGNAAAYVLGALPQAENQAFVAHLASCAVCREEVASLQSAAALLPAAVPQREAPAALKKRVMAAVNDDAKRIRAGAAGALSPRSARTPGGWLPMLAPLSLALALAVALAIVLASSASSAGKPREIEAQVSAHGARASVLLSGGHAQLTVEHMPQSGPGRVYEVWIERTGAPAPTATLFTVTSSGRATVGIPGSTAGVKEILVTSEPEGGTSVPTSAPVITAKLS